MSVATANESGPPGNRFGVSQASDPSGNSAQSDIELPVASERCSADAQTWSACSDPLLMEPQSWTSTVSCEATHIVEGAEDRQSRPQSRGDQAHRTHSGSRSPNLPWPIPSVTQPAQILSPRPWHLAGTSSSASAPVRSGTTTPTLHPGARSPNMLVPCEPYVPLGPGQMCRGATSSAGYRTPQRTGASISSGSSSVNSNTIASARGAVRQVSARQHLQAPGASVLTTAETTGMGPRSVPPPPCRATPSSLGSWRSASALG